VVAASARTDAGVARYVTPDGKAALPAVWSPWSEATTTYRIGCGVVRAIQSTISLVCAALPWPSATSTPSFVTTIRLTVVIFPPGSPARSASYDQTPGASCRARGKSRSASPRLATSPVFATCASEARAGATARVRPSESTARSRVTAILRCPM
jgi:hypothetical protein